MTGLKPRVALGLVALLMLAALVFAASTSAYFHLTSGSATAAFKAKILKQYPDALFPASEGQVCPEVLDFGKGPVSLCFAEYTTGKTWNFQGGTAEVEQGAILFSYPSHTSWRRKWRRCMLTRAPGKLFSNDNCGYGRPQTDAYFVWDELVPDIRLHHPLRAIGWQFTDSVGFNSLGRYNGKRQGKSFVFTNAVGDSFRYKP